MKVEKCPGLPGLVVFFILSLLCILPGCSGPVQPGENFTTTIPGGDESSAAGIITPSITATPLPAQPAQQSTTRREPVMVTTAGTTAGSGTIILDDTHSLTIREYKEYPFEDMGYDFLYEGDRFQVSIQSEKPVIVYVVGYMDAIRIQAPGEAPRYETGVTRLQWGSTAPVFFWERVTDRIGTFSIEDVGRYSLVVDPRWMNYDEDWKTGRPFTYRLRITKL